MENSKKERNIRRKRRIMSVRKHVRGSMLKPRLCVYKTNRHISAQLIDDEQQITVASASTLQKNFGKDAGKSKESAKRIGMIIAEKAKEKSITTIVFDR